MADDLKDLLEAISTLAEIEEGVIDLARFNRSKRVFGKDATGVLIIPWQLAEYGLSAKQAAEVWEAVWSDPESLVVWATYMKELGVCFNIPALPPPTPPPPEPVPTSRSTRKRDNPITTVLKSLAGKRTLGR